MKGWPMYTNIQSLKNLGFSKRTVAEKLGIHFNTVSKYWDMDADEFERTIANRERRRDLSLYEGVVIDWLKQHPDMMASHVHDWLKEHYEVKVSDSTVRRFVKALRKKYNIPKAAKCSIRQYMAVEDPPMGHQMQVDFGVVYVRDARTMSYRKLYCVACVLSHSRYKWGEWYTQALTATQLVSALQECFEYMGGMPKELVFDQDRLIAVDENYGDIIYTKEFEQFRQQMGFNVYLCRGADPESKGRVEAVVKYFKNNYARHRKYMELDIWNEDFLSWLDRTGNAKVHGTTKKIPAEVFGQEKLFLKPVPCTKKISTPIVTRTVHKDNTIFYSGCRYQLPLGTFRPGREVRLEIEEGILKICDIFDPVILVEYPVSKEKGRLIRNSNCVRDYSEPLDKLQMNTFRDMGEGEEAKLFLTQIRRLKPRYARDQFQLIQGVIEEYDGRAWQQALNYCITNSLYSAVEFRDAARYFQSAIKQETKRLRQEPKVVILPLVTTQKRSLSEYAVLAKGGETE